MAKQNAVGVPLNLDLGGTGSTSFTAGSVPFSNGTILTEDNSGIYYDDTNNRLGLGTTTPLDTLHVFGNMDLHHTAAENDDHALEIECDAAGFSDVKALDIAYVTGAIAPAEDEECILINIDETLSTGGEVVGMQVLNTTEGTAAIIALKCGPGCDAVRQEVGTFGNMDSALNKAVDVLAALSDGGAGNISIFLLDNETITIGDAASFGAMEIILATGASGSGVAPTFEYSTGVDTWLPFGPADGTNGFRNTGVIEWDVADLAGFAVGTGTEFLIRITRTRNSVSTTPIVDEIQIAALTEFKWDSSGDVNLNSLTLVTPMVVASGGTGSASHTAYAVLTGGTTSTGALQSIASVGTSGQALISNGAGALPTMQTLTAQGEPAPTTVNTISYFDDFLSGPLVNSPYTSSYTKTVAQANETKDNPGVLEGFSSSRVLLGALNDIGNFIGGGEITLTARVTMDGSIPTDSADHLFFGFSRNTGISTIARVGFYFNPSIVASNWIMSTAESSTATNTDTETAMTNSGTWQILKIVINAAGTSAEFFIDGVSEGTQSTNFPATTTNMLYGIRMASFPTNHNVDYMGYNQVMTGDRS